MKFTRTMWFLAVVGSMLSGAAVGCVQTQETVHFRYAQNTIVSGLNHPFGVAVDGSGNVYIADTGNKRVLKETLQSGGASAN